MARPPGFTVPVRVGPSHVSASTTLVWRSGLGPHSPSHLPVSGSTSLEGDVELQAGSRRTVRIITQVRALIVAIIGLEVALHIDHSPLACQPVEESKRDPCNDSETSCQDGEDAKQ